MKLKEKDIISTSEVFILEGGELTKVQEAWVLDPTGTQC